MLAVTRLRGAIGPFRYTHLGSLATIGRYTKKPDRLASDIAAATPL